MPTINPTHQLVILARLSEYCQYRGATLTHEKDAWGYMLRKLSELKEPMTNLKRDLFAVTSAALLKELKEEGYYLAIESNGIKPVPELIDFICVSPKSKKFSQMSGDELKFVLKAGDPLPEKVKGFSDYLISPEMKYDSPNFENINYCVELVKNNPEWRLSIQNHKFLKIR